MPAASVSGTAGPGAVPGGRGVEGGFGEQPRPPPRRPAFTPAAGVPPGRPPAPRRLPTAVLTGEPPPPPPPPLWSGHRRPRPGLNGATGNAELFNLRTGFDAARKTTDNGPVAPPTSCTPTPAQQVRPSPASAGRPGSSLNARDEVLSAGWKARPWSLFASTRPVRRRVRRAAGVPVRADRQVYAGVGKVHGQSTTPTVTLKLRAGVRGDGAAQIGSERAGQRSPGGCRSCRRSAKGLPEPDPGAAERHRRRDEVSTDEQARLEHYPRGGRLQPVPGAPARAAYEHVISRRRVTGCWCGWAPPRRQDRYDSNPGNSRRQAERPDGYFATFGAEVLSE